VTKISTHPKIYHITHINNLTSIVDAGLIEADSLRIQHGAGQTPIGMTDIKRRRLSEIQVSSHPNTMVGDYVPFYFCYRSIMLYILHMSNHPDLSHYRDGQGPILHFQIDMKSAINWANQNEIRWAFSDGNAGSYYTAFYNNLSDLDKINWDAVFATDFRDSLVKEGKQAEFLIHASCPWKLIEKIGVYNRSTFDHVSNILQNSPYKPALSIERTWYY